MGLHPASLWNISQAGERSSLGDGKRLPLCERGRVLFSSPLAAVPLYAISTSQKLYFSIKNKVKLRLTPPGLRSPRISREFWIPPVAPSPQCYCCYLGQGPLPLNATSLVCHSICIHTWTTLGLCVGYYQPACFPIHSFCMSTPSQPLAVWTLKEKRDTY